MSQEYNRTRTIAYLLDNGISEDELNHVLGDVDPIRDQIAMILLPPLAAAGMEDHIDAAVGALFSSLKATMTPGTPGIQGRILNVLRNGGVSRFEAMDFIHERERQRRMLAAGVLAGLISTSPESVWRLKYSQTLADLTIDACTRADAILLRRIQSKEVTKQSPASTIKSGPR